MKDVRHFPIGYSIIWRLCLVYVFFFFGPQEANPDGLASLMTFDELDLFSYTAGAPSYRLIGNPHENYTYKL